MGAARVLVALGVALLVCALAAPGAVRAQQADAADASSLLYRFVNGSWTSGTAANAVALLQGSAQALAYYAPGNTIAMVGLFVAFTGDQALVDVVKVNAATGAVVPTPSFVFGTGAGAMNAVETDNGAGVFVAGTFELPDGAGSSTGVINIAYHPTFFTTTINDGWQLLLSANQSAAFEAGQIGPLVPGASITRLEYAAPRIFVGLAAPCQTSCVWQFDLGAQLWSAVGALSDTVSALRLNGSSALWVATTTGAGQTAVTTMWQRDVSTTTPPSVAWQQIAHASGIAGSVLVMHFANDPFTAAPLLIVAGELSTIGGATGSGVFRYDTVLRAWDNMGGGLDVTHHLLPASIAALALSPDGLNLYASGFFFQHAADGSEVRGVANYSFATNAWTGLGSGVYGMSHDVLVTPDSVFVAVWGYSRPTRHGIFGYLLFLAAGVCVSTVVAVLVAAVVIRVRARRTRFEDGAPSSADKFGQQPVRMNRVTSFELTSGKIGSSGVLGAAASAAGIESSAATGLSYAAARTCMGSVDDSALLAPRGRTISGATDADRFRQRRARRRILSTVLLLVSALLSNVVSQRSSSVTQVALLPGVSLTDAYTVVGNELLIQSICGFFAALVFGGLSTRFPTLILLLVAISFVFVSQMLWLVLVSPSMAFLSFVLLGIGKSAYFTTALSYIARTTTPVSIASPVLSLFFVTDVVPHLLDEMVNVLYSYGFIEPDFFWSNVLIMLYIGTVGLALGLVFDEQKLSFSERRLPLRRHCRVAHPGSFTLLLVMYMVSRLAYGAFLSLPTLFFRESHVLLIYSLGAFGVAALAWGIFMFVFRRRGVRPGFIAALVMTTIGIIIVCAPLLSLGASTPEVTRGDDIPLLIGSVFTAGSLNVIFAAYTILYISLLGQAARGTLIGLLHAFGALLPYAGTVFAALVLELHAFRPIVEGYVQLVAGSSFVLVGLVLSLVYRRLSPQMLLPFTLASGSANVPAVSSPSAARKSQSALPLPFPAASHGTVTSPRAAAGVTLMRPLLTTSEMDLDALDVAGAGAGAGAGAAADADRLATERTRTAPHRGSGTYEAPHLATSSGLDELD